MFCMREKTANFASQSGTIPDDAMKYAELAQW